MDEHSLRYEGWRVAAASGAGFFFASLPIHSILLKPLSEEFSWSRQAVSSAYALMAITAAVSAPLLGT